MYLVSFQALQSACLPQPFPCQSFLFATHAAVRSSPACRSKAHIYHSHIPATLPLSYSSPAVLASSTLRASHTPSYYVISCTHAPMLAARRPQPFTHPVLAPLDRLHPPQRDLFIVVTSPAGLRGCRSLLCRLALSGNKYELAGKILNSILCGAYSFLFLFLLFLLLTILLFLVFIFFSLFVLIISLIRLFVLLLPAYSWFLVFLLLPISGNDLVL